MSLFGLSRPMLRRPQPEETPRGNNVTNFATKPQGEDDYARHLARIYAMTDRIAQFEALDWKALQARDPMVAETLYRKFLEAKDALGKSLAVLQKQARQKALDAQREDARRIREAHTSLERDLEDWNPETLGRLTEFGTREFGFAPDEIAGVDDPRMLKVLHRAFSGDQALKRQAAFEQAASPADVTENPAVEGALGDEQRISDWMRQRNDQVRKRRR
jgi:hypothetical protein